MTGTQFANYVRKQTKTNSATFTNADILLYANLKKDDIAKKITGVNEDYFGIFMTRNLVINQRNYAFEPTQLNHMKYLEACLDGTTWKRLMEYDINNLGITTDEASIVAAMSMKQPGFDIFGNEIIILSDTAIIDVTDGLKLWTIIYPADLTEGDLSGSDDLSVPPSSTSFGLPRQFHKLWADAVVVEWKNSQDRPIALTAVEQQFDARLEYALTDIKGGNLDRVVTASVPYNDGSQY